MSSLGLSGRVPVRYRRSMSLGWLQPRRLPEPNPEERRALEEWVRKRFRMASTDPMEAVIGAVGRLTEAGIEYADATETVLRIVRECAAASARCESDNPGGANDRAGCE
jgi:hypothetical protein